LTGLRGIRIVLMAVFGVIKAKTAEKVLTRYAPERKAKQVEKNPARQTSGLDKKGKTPKTVKGE
jgi:hypothetical protein